MHGGGLGKPVVIILKVCRTVRNNTNCLTDIQPTFFSSLLLLQPHELNPQTVLATSSCLTCTAFSRYWLAPPQTVIKYTNLLIIAPLAIINLVEKVAVLAICFRPFTLPVSCLIKEHLWSLICWFHWSVWCTWPLVCSENIKNHIFYKPDSNYGALIYGKGIWRNKFKFQISSLVLRHLKIWNILTKGIKRVKLFVLVSSIHSFNFVLASMQIELCILASLKFTYKYT